MCMVAASERGGLGEWAERAGLNPKEGHLPRGSRERDAVEPGGNHVVEVISVEGVETDSGEFGLIKFHTGLVGELPWFSLGAVPAVFSSCMWDWCVFSYSGAEFVPCDVAPIPEVEVKTAGLWVGLRLFGEA